MSSPQFPIAPGPWHLEGEVYWMLLKPMKTLPAGAYAPLEQPKDDDPHEKTNRYLGGQGIVWIVRYASSPVGPYDELMYQPGDFPTPSGGKSTRITRLYVSSHDTTFNGRRNWNVAKHLAKFSFTPQGSNRTLVEVFDYTEDPKVDAPFFAAIATAQRFLPALPFSTRWLGLEPMVHPPIPAGPKDKPEEVGTTEWAGVDFELHGRIKLAWFEPAPLRAGGKIPPGAYSDGVGFPQIEIRSFGVWFTPGVCLEFGAPLPVEGASPVNDN
ncbi:hypothetical protein AURDEDRAFT_175537 [Auricularia subglabra TFB-10046 SS5]|uniref:Acetoacetate decarboxylase n=1 Tax=Auricularia subglabra (strain TFB-10046 / SS5) TaxID=717982 RepID=J0D868_AURST|nr:hypothetical protein AURDEDRAFT_175537 [Auricularia subglabra TFB-10046 SS5]